MVLAPHYIENLFFATFIYTILASSLICPISIRATFDHFFTLIPAFFGITISENHSFIASSIRFCNPKIFFTTPVSDISPKNTRLPSGMFFLEEIIAATVARSIPGSEIESPRATFTYTSSLSSFTLPHLERTAISRSIFPQAIPLAERFG